MALQGAPGSDAHSTPQLNQPPHEWPSLLISCWILFQHFRDPFLTPGSNGGHSSYPYAVMSETSMQLASIPITFPKENTLLMCFVGTLANSSQQRVNLIFQCLLEKWGCDRLRILIQFEKLPFYKLNVQWRASIVTKWSKPNQKNST